MLSSDRNTSKQRVCNFFLARNRGKSRTRCMNLFHFGNWATLETGLANFKGYVSPLDVLLTDLDVHLSEVGQLPFEFPFVMQKHCCANYYSRNSFEKIK